MVDRNKVKALSSYKEILSKKYKDVSSSIQEKKGAFKFDPVAATTGYTDLREYRVASNGNVSWSKVGYNKVIAKMLNLDKVEEYNKAFRAILDDIDKFSEKMSRRSSLVDERAAYRKSILDMPLEVKKRVVRAFFIIAIFEYEYLSPREVAKQFIEKLKVEKSIDAIISSKLHPDDVADFKKYKRIVDRLI